MQRNEVSKLTRFSHASRRPRCRHYYTDSRVEFASRVHLSAISICLTLLSCTWIAPAVAIYPTGTKKPPFFISSLWMPSVATKSCRKTSTMIIDNDPEQLYSFINWCEMCTYFTHMRWLEWGSISCSLHSLDSWIRFTVESPSERF